MALPRPFECFFARTKSWSDLRFGAALLGLTGIVLGAGYELVVWVGTSRGVTVWSPETALDGRIPFLPWSFVLYATLYLYFPLPFLVAERSAVGRRELMALHVAIARTAGISFLVFLALPCEVRLRAVAVADLAGGAGIWPAVYRGLHVLDRPFNAWPSLHVSLSLLVALFVDAKLLGRVPRALLWIAFGAMVVSTLTTKQHHVFDALTGALLALAVWRLSAQRHVKIRTRPPRTR